MRSAIASKLSGQSFQKIGEVPRKNSDEIIRNFEETIQNLTSNQTFTSEERHKVVRASCIVGKGANNSSNYSIGTNKSFFNIDTSSRAINRKEVV